MPDRLDLAAVRAALAELGPPRPPELVLPDSRQAAVLVALFEEGGQARVIFTRRTTTLPSHQGEVSFPGGKSMPGEAPLAAALRESHEEIGLDPSSVSIVAELDHLTTVASRFVLAPFVGALPGRPVLTPNPHEVDAVLDASLLDLARPGVFREERWDVAALADRPVYFFELGEDVVWGATARILHHLLTVVLTGRTGPPPLAL
jgi:8-oxo-dGTP pyrophosphatase MutT (NUDIX family)